MTSLLLVSSLVVVTVLVMMVSDAQQNAMDHPWLHLMGLNMSICLIEVDASLLVSLDSKGLS